MIVAPSLVAWLVMNWPSLGCHENMWVPIAEFDQINAEELRGLIAQHVFAPIANCKDLVESKSVRAEECGGATVGGTDVEQLSTNR